MNRLVMHVDIDKKVVVCNERCWFMVAEQAHLTSIGAHVIISEPVGRNIASVMALAVFDALQKMNTA